MTTVRRGEPRDHEACAAIYLAAAPLAFPWLPSDAIRREQLEAALREEELWVAEREGAIVGWLSFQDFYGRPAYGATAELSIYVSETAQRGGVGRHLLARALEHAPALGLATLLGFIFAHNTPSVTLFERHGFARWGHLPRVARLDGVERDLLILGRRL